MSTIESKAITSGTCVAFSSQLKVINCHACGGTYAMSTYFLDSRRDDGEGWNCPYCRGSTAYCESETDKLKKQLAKQQEWTAYQRREKEEYLRQRDTLERSRNGMKGVLVREQKKLARVRRGVCPCCNRHFKNVQRHMDSQHPNYKVHIETET